MARDWGMGEGQIKEFTIFIPHFIYREIATFLCDNAKIFAQLAATRVVVAKIVMSAQH